MNIRWHHYTLQPGRDPARAARSPRNGALLRIEFDDHAIGYADLHPWPEFGHTPLEDHLASLEQGHPTPLAALAALALAHARTDADARREGISLFDGLLEVRSHALFTDWTKAPRSAFEQCADSGYTSAKLKIGRNLAREVEALNRLAGIPLRWRLDANAAFTAGGGDAAATACSAAVPGGESIKSFLASLDPIIRRGIEFLEDPCAYAPAAWTALSDAAPLALDWQLPQLHPPWPGAQVLVIKPASQDAFRLASTAVHAGMKIVVTHSMDHPLGQSAALWTAMHLRQRYGTLILDGGLQADGLYEPDEFSGQIPARGPMTIPPPGTGFGFDKALQALDWQS